MNKSTTLTMSRFMLAKAFGRPYIGDAANSINTYLDSVDPEPALDADYTMDYIVMGNNGYLDINGPENAEDLPLSGVPGRNNRIGVLFGFLPFRVFKAGTDLTDAERATFGLRKRFLAEGQYYHAYFSKRIDTISNVETIVTKNATGASITSPITPLMLPIRASNITGTDNVTASIKINVDITAADISGSRKYADLVHGSENHGLIREIGLCIGSEGADPLPTASGLELVSSSNIGFSAGVITPKTIQLSFGRATSVIRL